MSPELQREIELTPLILADRDEPFWGFGEIFVVVGVFLAALLVISEGTLGLLHDRAKLGYWQLIQEMLAYLALFAALKVIFFWAGKPLFRSLGWLPQPFPVFTLASVGFFLSMISIVLLVLLRTPEIQTPFDKMLNGDPLSRIAITTFGITLGPVIEELLFRGFLQPVLVNLTGVLPGILVTSALFGGLHLAQNADLWQSGIIIALAGFVFGIVRHVSGSTKASSIVHIGYNSLPFLLEFMQIARPAAK